LYTNNKGFIIIEVLISVIILEVMVMILTNCVIKHVEINNEIQQEWYSIS